MGLPTQTGSRQHTYWWEMASTGASVIGLGFVGSALHKSFALKKVAPLGGYDRYKNGGIGTIEECLCSPIIFLCLPTLYDEIRGEYDKTAIRETLANLENYKYDGVVVIKSTVEPGTTDELSKIHPELTIIHNPEFLSAATAFYDFHNQPTLCLAREKIALTRASKLFVISTPPTIQMQRYR